MHTHIYIYTLDQYFSYTLACTAGDHHQQQMLSFDEEEEEEETSSSGASSDDDNEYVTSPDTHDHQDESRHDDWRKVRFIEVCKLSSGFVYLLHFTNVSLCLVPDVPCRPFK
jgi:hypothetical protein